MKVESKAGKIAYEYDFFRIHQINGGCKHVVVLRRDAQELVNEVKESPFKWQ